jgi:GNAT superfamily N-acetyltransferase
MKHIIRKANREDIPRIKEIRFVVKENRLADPTRVTHKDIEWFIENGPIWVWEQDEVLLGFSAGDPRDGSVWALFVDPSSEGKGIGDALFKCCCESLVAAGHKELTLCTDRGTRAEGFYRARGWVEKGISDKNQIFTKTVNV